MKLPCKVIEDMLPMYYDKVCSEESAALVEEHLKDCDQCSRMLSDLRSDMDIPEKKVDDIKPLKRIQKSYKKMRLGWLIAIVCVVVLVPATIVFGHQQGEQDEQSKHTVAYTQEEALAYANEFMICLVEGNYAKAYTYWDVKEEKDQFLNDYIFTEEELKNFEADGLKKFCEGGKELDALGGIQSFEVVWVSDASYSPRHGTESYEISYGVLFAGKTESFRVHVTQNGISYISAAGGLVNHPLTHLTFWVQWLVDDYLGQYYDRELGQWVERGE